MKCLNSRLITIFICLNLALFPSFLFAGNIGGWSLGSPVASGASAIVNGTKEIILNGASKIAKGTAKITPNAAQVAKVLRGGVAGYALSVAVEQLLGSVDWVLDPANNRITYVDPNVKSPADIYCKEQAAIKFGAGSEWAKKAVYQADGPYAGYCVLSDNRSFALFIAGTQDTTIPEEEQKTLPLDVVAQQVISNAAGGDASAQQAITAAAQDVINEAENDSAKAAPIINQLEASKSVEAENTATGEQTQNPEKPNVTDISLEFPAFCGWAPTVCEAAQTVISFPRTLTNWWDTANQKADGWANSISLAWSDFWKEPNLEKEKDTEVNVDEKEVQDPSQFDQMYVQFGGQCPTFEVNTISVGSVSVPISFDLSPYCDFALKVRPAVIGFGYLVALGIVSNAIREV